MLTVPGLARSAEPVLENCRQSMVNLKAQRYLQTAIKDGHMAARSL